MSLAQLSDGAYDVTVGPLVNLWGFGPDPATYRVPDDAAIAAARARVGWRKVEVDVERHRARKQPGVRVDLSSLGKGRGVDRVAEYLDAQGVANYLIDLSGKLRARGRNAHGTAWQVAVEQPAPDDPSGSRRARFRRWWHCATRASPPPVTTGASSKAVAGTIRTSSIRAAARR